MTTYGYCRVSKESQVSEGHSLETQSRMLEGYALMHNLPIDKVFIEEGISGSVPLFERPQGQILLAMLKPGDAVITSKLDRMFRSALDALSTREQFRKLKCSLHILDLGGDVIDSALGRFMFTIISAVAEAERDKISERIRDIKKMHKKQGKFLGGNVPLGYVRQGDMLIPTGENLQERIRKLSLCGLSYRDIAERVGISHVSVQNILKRKQPQSKL